MASLQNVAVIRTLCRKYYAKHLCPKPYAINFKFITFNNATNCMQPNRQSFKRRGDPQKSEVLRYNSKLNTLANRLVTSIFSNAPVIESCHPNSVF